MMHIYDEIRRYYYDDRIADRIVRGCRHRYVMMRLFDGHIVRYFQPHDLSVMRRYGHKITRGVYELVDKESPPEAPRLEVARIGHAANTDPLCLRYFLFEKEVVEFVPEVSTWWDVYRSPYLCVDIDPKDDFEDSLIVNLASVVAARFPYGTKIADGHSEGIKIRFTGNRGFHIWVLANKPVDLEKARESLLAVLQPITKTMPFCHFDMKSTTGVYLDIQVNRPRKCIRTLYSLHAKTHLACVPVPNLWAWSREDAKIENILARGPIDEPF